MEQLQINPDDLRAYILAMELDEIDHALQVLRLGNFDMTLRPTKEIDDEVTEEVG